MSQIVLVGDFTVVEEVREVGGVISGRVHRVSVGGNATPDTVTGDVGHQTASGTLTRTTVSGKVTPQ